MLPLFALAVLSLAETAPASPASPTSNWKVRQTDHFCYAWLGVPEQGGTELGVVLDAKDNTKLILSNPAWKVVQDHNYPVSAGVDGVMKVRRARAVKLGSDWVALVADIGEQSFVEDFSKASSLAFAVQKVAGASQGNFAVAGAAAAARDLKTCHASLKARVRAMSKDKVERETVFRTDSQGEHGTGAGLKDE